MRIEQRTEQFSNPYNRVRAHHDGSGWLHTENALGTFQERKGGESFRTAWHIHVTGLTIPQAEALVAEQEFGSRFKVTGIQSSMSPKDAGEPPGCFILLESTEPKDFDW